MTAHKELACPACGSTNIRMESPATVSQSVDLMADGTLDYGVYESDDVEFTDEKGHLYCGECFATSEPTSDRNLPAEWIRDEQEEDAA